MALPRVDIQNKSHDNRTHQYASSSPSANSVPPSPPNHSRSRPHISSSRSSSHSQHHSSSSHHRGAMHGQDPYNIDLYYQQPPAGQKIPNNLHNKDCGARYKSSPAITKECVWLSNSLLKF